MNSLLTKSITMAIILGILNLVVFQIAMAEMADPLIDDGLYFDDGVTTTTVSGTIRYSNGLVAKERDGETILFSLTSTPGEENQLRDISIQNAARQEIILVSDPSTTNCSSIGGKDFKDYCN